LRQDCNQFSLLTGPITREFFLWLRQVQLARGGDRHLAVRGNTRFWVDETTFSGLEQSMKKLQLSNLSLKGLLILFVLFGFVLLVLVGQVN
jgi:hypothetical protein